MEINYLDELPNVDFNTRDGRWVRTFREWMESDAKVIKLSLKNADEKRMCYQAIRNFIAKNKLDYTIYCERGKYNVYVVRA